MYQALYRKYRPQTFDDVVGQRSITQTLKNQLITGRLSHAYLFTGTRGTGKTSCAKILAKCATNRGFRRTLPACGRPGMPILRHSEEGGTYSGRKLRLPFFNPLLTALKYSRNYFNFLLGHSKRKAYPCAGKEPFRRQNEGPVTELPQPTARVRTDTRPSHSDNAGRRHLTQKKQKTLTNPHTPHNPPLT